MGGVMADLLAGKYASMEGGVSVTLGVALKVRYDSASELVLSLQELQ